MPNPTRTPRDVPSLELRYGSYSVERLLNDIFARGGNRKTIQIKVFGGANILRNNGNIGHRNADFIEDYLAKEGLTIAAAHLRGELPRRVRFSPSTGTVQMAELSADNAGSIYQHEAKLRNLPGRQQLAGKYELFHHGSPSTSGSDGLPPRGKAHRVP